MGEPSAPEEPSAECTPEWCSVRDEVVLIVRGVTFRTASRVALVVGTLLTAVNQGPAIVEGDVSTVTWLRVAANYCIPYVVSSVGYLAPFRQEVGRGREVG